MESPIKSKLLIVMIQLCFSIEEIAIEHEILEKAF